jgi:rhamnulokinase
LLEGFHKAAIVAVDLGAESCRVSLLKSIHGKPRMSLVHRCANGPVVASTGLMWDFERMWEEVVVGLRKCADLAPEGIASIGVDGWAVDYVRLGHDGRAIDKPFCYRDERTVAAIREVHNRIPPQRLYELTGAQHLRINTLYQLYADNLRGVPPELPWVNLPEYLLFRLGGRRVSEYTNATHTQLLDIISRDWCPEVFEAAGLSLSAAPPVVQPGTDIGQLAGELTDLSAFRSTRLIAPACHDTASAVAGIPAAGDDWAFLSSGTWSLVGAVVDHPHTGPASRVKNFTNQGGIGETIYLLKNVNGMWLLRQCLEHWRAQGADWDILELVEASATLAAPDDLLDVDDADLLLPGDMPARINSQLKTRGYRTLQQQLSAAPHYANLIFHSLAARYAQVLEDLATITGKRFDRLFVVGGGARNRYLQRLTEASSGLRVIHGSAESSTIGNFAIQLAALERPASSTGVPSGAVEYWASALAEHTSPLEREEFGDETSAKPRQTHERQTIGSDRSSPGQI